MNDTIYITGKTSNGEILIGGVWRMSHQDGFPLELSNMLAKEKGWRIDWLEAMADASIDNNLSSLMRQLESFMQEEEIKLLKIGFQYLIENLTPEQILLNKKTK